MIIYRAKIKKDLTTTNKDIETIIKNDDHIYLYKHGYDLQYKDKSYEYITLNTAICFDISELEFIEECPKIDTENSPIILTTKPEYKNLIPSQIDSP